MNGIIASLLGNPMKNLARLLMLASCWTWGAGAAHACSCDPISPEAGFDRAQYVFAGKVVKAETHTWQVEVERVWKGHEKLGRTVKLMDVYATIDCEFFFHLGSAISSSRFWRRAVETYFITRRSATGQNPCNRRAFPLRATSPCGWRT